MVDLDPLFVSFGRAAVAGLLAVIYLVAVRAPRPTPVQWRSLFIVAAFVVVGFPTLTGIALQAKTSAHVAVITALMPAATAVAAVLRAGERPSRMFWMAAAAGAVAVTLFAFSQGAGGLDADDVLLLVAVVIIGIGYAEGGALSRTLGGARTICWALLLALPLTIPVMLVVAASERPGCGRSRRPGSGSCTSACSRCSWASSPGMAASHVAASHASARCSWPSRC